MQIRLILTIGFMFSLIAVTGQQVKPLRIGVAGLTHAHVGWLLSRAHDSDIVIVGI
ncbi:MAG: gfo/Idh/MocA family oxidoreductase, partial [Bacteroidetes bacterium]